MSFAPGDLVLCVDDRDSDELGFSPWPAKVFRGGLDGLRRGCVYTVRGTRDDPFDGKPCVFLMEIQRPYCPAFDGEAPYAACRFRPLDSSRLDVFRAALTDKPVSEEVG